MRKISLLIFIYILISYTAISSDYYVSKHGNDSNSGKSINQSFKTIQQAVNVLKPGDRCFIDAGVYREKVTFLHSGTAGNPIVVMPYQNARVIVTGLDELTGWKETTTQGVFETTANADLGRGKNQLFYNGEVMLEARYPNTPVDSLRLPVSNLSKLQPTFGDFKIINNSRIEGSSVKGSAKDYWKGAMYYGIHWDGWSAQTAIVQSSDETGINVANQTSRWWRYQRMKGHPDVAELGRGMLIGVKNAMDIKGEWVLENNVFSFISPDGKNPTGNAEYKVRQLAFDLSGQSNIFIRNLHIKAASVLMANTSNCSLENCTVDYLSHFTIFDDARNGEVEKLGDRRALTNGELGIYISGNSNRIENCSIQYSAGAGIYLDGHGHTVHNNLINECSYTCTYLAAIMIGVEDDFLCGGHTISYNTLSNGGRSLFHFDGGVQTRDGYQQKYLASLITHNHLFNGMLQARDGGLVNSWNSDVGAFNNQPTIFSYNVCHDAYDPMQTIYKWQLGTLYWDNSTNNLWCLNNLVLSKPGAVPNGHVFNPPTINTKFEDGKFVPVFTGKDYSNIPDSCFPQNKPFAYGHNFTKVIPPAANKLNQFTQAVAINKTLSKSNDVVTNSMSFNKNAGSLVLEYATSENVNTSKIVNKRPNYIVLDTRKNDGKSKGIQIKYNGFCNAKAGDYLMYKDIAFGEGYGTIVLEYSSNNSNAKWVEIRLDSLNGKTVEKIDLPYSEGQLLFDKQNKILHPFVRMKYALKATIQGTHHLYLVFGGGGGNEVAQIVIVRFEDYKGNIPLSNDEAQIEVRLDDKDGDVVAVFHPHNTAGKYRKSIEAIITNKPISGTHKLYFTSKSLGNPTYQLKAVSIGEVTNNVN